MTEGDIDVLRRIAESSPVIVLLCMVAIIALWRRLEKKDDALIQLHRETLTALGAVKNAVDDLKQALQDRSR